MPGKKNANLSAARSAKNDEFYTQWADIEKEMVAYVDHNPDVFRDKTILLPCDDPEWSNFTKFFALRFTEYGIKRLISTSYAPDSRPEGIPYRPTLFETEDPKYDQGKTRSHGKKFVLDRSDINGDGTIDIDDLQWEYLEGDGDFRSAEVSALRDEADIAITNPPFSLFRDYIAWLMEGDVKFAAIGNMNAITYKEVFPLIKKNKIWLGTSQPKKFRDGSHADGGAMKSFGNIKWFTNIEHGRRSEGITGLMTATEVKRFINTDKRVQSVGLRPYDKYDAIEVPLVKAIPSDYDGVMGVPITFLDKYNPDQFEIVDANLYRRSPDTPKKPHGLIKDKDSAIDGKPVYVRIAIRHKKKGKK